MTQKTKHFPKSLKIVLVYVLAILLEFAAVNAYLASAITVSSGVWNGTASYMVWKEGSTYFAKDAGGQIDYSGTNATSIVLNCINAIYTVGGKISFTSQNFTFTAKIVLPIGSHSITFSGQSGMGKSHEYNEMPTAGTIFQSAISGDALFEQDATIDKRSSCGFVWENIIFVGSNTTDSIALRLTNVDEADVRFCQFFMFDIAILGDYYRNTKTPENVDALKAEMPGMLWAHDNCFSEILGCAIKLDEFIQSKIHNNEFESWAAFSRHIWLKNTNVINIDDNRFTNSLPDDALEEVILIETTNEFYCNQISISDNIADISAHKPLFINLTNTTAAPIYPSRSIVSRDNVLNLNYVPAYFTDDLYNELDSAYGNLDAHDHITTIEKYGNFNDLSTLSEDTWYRNDWVTWQIYVWANATAANDYLEIYVGKETDEGAVIIKFRAESAGEMGGGTVEVPTGWYFKYSLGGSAVLKGLYGIQR